MTRPMPGPPGGFTDRARLNYALLGKQITYEQYQEFGDALTRAFTARPKRLTDAECYDEWGAFEHVESYGLLCTELGDKRMTPSRFEREANESDTWRRFATHPHALDAT